MKRTLIVRTYREARVAGSGADFGSGQCARLRERRDRFRLLHSLISSVDCELVVQCIQWSDSLPRWVRAGAKAIPVTAEKPWEG